MGVLMWIARVVAGVGCRPAVKGLGWARAPKEQKELH